MERLSMTVKSDEPNSTPIHGLDVEWDFLIYGSGWAVHYFQQFGDWSLGRWNHL
jgi:hypothetical protein